MPQVLYPGGGNCDDGTSPCVGPNCIGDPINDGDGPVIPPEPCLFGCNGTGNTCTGPDCDDGECVGPNCEYTTNGGEWHVYWMCDPYSGSANQVIVGVSSPAPFGPVLLQSQIDHYEQSLPTPTVGVQFLDFTPSLPAPIPFFTYLGMATGSTLVEVVGINGGINMQSPWPGGFSGFECEPSEPEPSETGCQDPTACNYSATATIHDQTSCLYTSGCTTESSFNYNAFAGCDDGTCCDTEGCTDRNAFNFISEACFDDGSCCYVQGCMDPSMFNYDPLACFPGVCVLIELGCIDPTATNYNPNANTDDGSCIYPEGDGGCTVPGASNYDPLAAIANNSKCEWHIPRFCLSDVEQPTGVSLLFSGTSNTNDAYLIFPPTAQPTNTSTLITIAYLTTIKDFISSVADPYVAALEGVLGAPITPGDSITYAWGANKTACMKFLGYDSYYGDGSQIMNSIISPTPISLGPMASVPGTYFQNPNVLSIYTSESCGNCSGDPSGCTDAVALNYDPFATIDDDSCMFTGVYGCTDSAALNFDSLATIDDGTCVYYEGCTDPTATNYDPLATVNDGSCIAIISGCTDSTATNYDAGANTDDGSCTYATYGCTNPNATNYNQNATIDDGSCILCVYGCTDDSYTQYDPLATCDDGSCKTLKNTGENTLGMSEVSTCVIGGQDYNVTWTGGDPTHNVMVTFEIYDTNQVFDSAIIVVSSQPNVTPQEVLYFIPTYSAIGVANPSFKFKVTSLNDGTSDSSEFFYFCT